MRTAFAAGNAIDGDLSTEWVIARGGRIVYKSDWTSAANVEGFLQRYRGARAARTPGVGMSPLQHRADRVPRSGP
ncbi:MAG: hypothetical protein H0V93_11885 [Euzebyales bacterium]|nr:hypothetical protein [Euzebyales bacterium]